MDDVERLIAEARAEARAEVKEELRRKFVDELRKQAADELRPRPAEPRVESPPAVGGGAASPPVPAADGPGEVVYVYCVTERSEVSVPVGIAGAEVHAVVADGLAAWVSGVPRAEFGEEPLRRNLNDLVWLEKAARAHQEVLDAAAAAGTIVPLRLCTIYESDERVRAMLSEQRELFAEALDLLRGKSEWGVKIYADPPAPEEEAETRTESGQAYLAHKQAVRDAREEARKAIRECVEEAHARFEEWAADAVLNRPQNRDLAHYEGEMVLNAAYLMDDDRAGEFAELVAELEKHHDGLRFELTGPWPPYNFVPGRGNPLL